MKFSYNWLKECVDFSLSPEDLAEALTLAGHEVEGIEYTAKTVKNITVGKINSIKKHPDADKLVICDITDGTTSHQILTAATNVFEGAVIPISLPGAELASGLKIKPVKMRGIVSNGMLCSEVELGVQEQSDGIWILPDDVPLGVDFVDYAKLQDAILDVSILPNRGDCQSIIGLARDIAVTLGLPLKTPETSIKTTDLDYKMSITINANEACPLYTGRYLTDIQSKPSPLWMQRKLQSAGIRSLGLAIDITNLVLLEFGQPLHAFDYDQLKEKDITVRFANENETLQTLDEEQRHCDASNLLISNEKQAVALAGIMGGKDSGVSDSTRSIYLESAYFDPIVVRKTASKFSLRTESSIRFEKAVDSDTVAIASDRACHLYQTLTGAKIASKRDEVKIKTSPLFNKTNIPFSAQGINDLLGSAFSEDVINKTLNDLGFELKEGSATVPSWRQNDVQELPCLAEEVARIQGLDSITTRLPESMVIVEEKSPLANLRDQTDNYFVQHGFYQCNTFPMISKKNFISCDLPLGDGVYELQNPITPEEAIMRTSLLPSLLKSLSFNIKRQKDQVQIFEVAKTYHKNNGTLEETTECLALSYGSRQRLPFGESPTEFEFAHLKGLAVGLMESLGYGDASFVSSEQDDLHPLRQQAISIGDEPVGSVGNLHPVLAEKFDIEKPVSVIRLKLSKLSEYKNKKVSYQNISKYPSTRRDIALLAPKELPYADIESAIRDVKPKHVIDSYLFDCFESDKLGQDKKSIAIALIFQHQERTLSDDEVNSVFTSLIETLTSKLPVSIR